MKKVTLILLALILAFTVLPVHQVKASMPMAQTITVPLREYQPGNYTVELRTLPGNSAGAMVIFTRAGLPGTNNDVLARVDFQFSRDNGATWQSLYAASIPGGVLYDKNGNELTQSMMLVTWPGEAGPNGRVMLKGSDVRIVADVYIAFRTEITVQSITSTANNGKQ